MLVVYRCVSRHALGMLTGGTPGLSGLGNSTGAVVAATANGSALVLLIWLWASGGIEGSASAASSRSAHRKVK